MMSFAAEGADGGDDDGEEWVATHTSKGNSSSYIPPATRTDLVAFLRFFHTEETTYDWRHSRHRWTDFPFF